jgi:hypothetical protein
MKTRLRSVRILATGLVAALLPLVSQAADLFEVEATSGATTIRVSDSNVLDLVEKLVDTKDQFAAFNGTNFSGSLRYQGIPDAVSFQQNNDGSGVISFNLIGETYNYANEDDLEDFLKANGEGIYARFLKEVAKQSAVSVTDGNPSSTTASSTREDFQNFGMTQVGEFDFGEGAILAAEEGVGLGGFGLGFNSGRFEADVAGVSYEGQFAEIGFAWLNVGLGDRVRLVAPISASYLTIEGTAVYGLSQSFALPIRILQMNKTDRWNWRLTPIGGVNVRVSPDALSGSLLWNAGLVNSIDYRVNRRLIVCLINQATVFRSIPVEYSDYSFDADIDQIIAKNGLRFVTPITRRIVGDVFFIRTDFLEEAAVENFYTFGASVSFKATKRFNLTLGANYDIGETDTDDEFKSYSVGLSSAWRW